MLFNEAAQDIKKTLNRGKFLNLSKIPGLLQILTLFYGLWIDIIRSQSFLHGLVAEKYRDYSLMDIKAYHIKPLVILILNLNNIYLAKSVRSGLSFSNEESSFIHSESKIVLFALTYYWGYYLRISSKFITDPYRTNGFNHPPRLHIWDKMRQNC
eukprot:snap_masked-scaffold_1-processed-gene-13.23-mRNA-1 protein AED:1.00 eAED:1.00 QI:0/0/0/0/1/1/2/0/154